MNTETPYDRPDWQTWALGIAEAVSRRGDCTRRRVGAVLVDTRHRVFACGYNGTAPGGKSCLKGECPRGRHYRMTYPSFQECGTEVRCACGKNWEAGTGCEDSVAPGSSYDTGPGVCHASHAEQNALADVEARYRLDGATMLVTEEPCHGCLRQIENTTRVAEVIWPGGVHLFKR